MKVRTAQDYHNSHRKTLKLSDKFIVTVSASDLSGLLIKSQLFFQICTECLAYISPSWIFIRSPHEDLIVYPFTFGGYLADNNCLNYMQHDGIS